ncbi:EI24 domain-containing protein [uncultured Fusobacterium sp.]|uniref:EI24 domain-containing protein n=1 Tax=uncultured Fusobacterium sp. TaxID=159267 RepID=UPI0025D8F58A|nr:EI24 domain-containing protein [uncultured Fusobacterium sp.]
MKTISLVFNSFLDSFSIVKEAKLKKFYFLPGIIGILLFIIFIWIGDFLSVNLAVQLESFFKLEEFHSILYIFIKILVWMCTVFFYYLVYKSLLLVIISPILGYVSERVETHLTGKKFDFTFKDNIRFLLRGIDIGLKSFFKQMVGTCAVMLLGFIFPINLSIPLLIFIIQGYFTGFSFMDYTLERYNLSSK